MAPPEIDGKEVEAIIAFADLRDILARHGYELRAVSAENPYKVSKIGNTTGNSLFTARTMQQLSAFHAGFELGHSAGYRTREKVEGCDER